MGAKITNTINALKGSYACVIAIEENTGHYTLLLSFSILGTTTSKPFSLINKRHIITLNSNKPPLHLLQMLSAIVGFNTAYA